MIQEHELPQLPGDWPEERDLPRAPLGAQYDYRPGDARVTITWQVSPDRTFDPESEALAIATLLEQVQSFTVAFDLAHLGRLQLLHQDGAWCPVRAVAAANGNGIAGPAPGPAPEPPAPEPPAWAPMVVEVLPKPEPEPEVCTSFADPVPRRETWQEMQQRLRREREEADRELKEGVMALQQPSGTLISPPPTPERSLDQLIQEAEDEGRLLPTRGPAKRQEKPKRRTHGQSLDLDDQIVRLVKHAGRPVYATYVARQLNLSYNAAYNRLRRLVEQGELESRIRQTAQNKEGYEFTIPEKKK